jgi:hypothetical protein
LFKIWNRNVLDVDTFAHVEATIGRSSRKADIRVNDDTVEEDVKVEDAKVEVGKDQAADITLEETDVPDVKIVAVEHRNKRKGICSISHWQGHEQHRRPC